MPDLYIGLISGTSMDAIDAVLADLDQAIPELIHSHRHPIPADLRRELLQWTEFPDAVRLPRLGELDVLWGELFADAALSLLQAAGIPSATVRAIGSHGQTLFHCPDGPTPFTIQLGDPNSIAEKTGITTVADFRRRDLAAGGQGAPLVPAFHASIFRDTTEDRVVLNLGGIANITVLPADASKDIRGFDTGPGNVLLDTWCRQHRGEPYDAQGAWGAAGAVHTALLQTMLAEPFFQRAPPKSTGRELFNPAWLQSRMESLSKPLPADADIQATLAELTARTVADALRLYAPGTQRVLVCGGGVHNQDLLNRLRRNLITCEIASTIHHHLDPDWVEAVAFAWLAKQTLNGKPGNLPTVTGARRPVVLGAIYPG